MTFEWTRRPVVQKAARIAGYAAFGLLVFAVSLVLTFPTARLRGFLEARMSQGGMTVRIQDLSVRGLGTVRLFGVKVDLPPDRLANPDGSVTEDPRSVTLDRLDVSVGLFRPAFGGLKVAVTAYAGEGSLGPVTVLKTAEQVTVDVEGAKDFPLPSDLPLFGVRFGGKLTSLKVSATYDVKGGLAASKARVELKAEGLKALKPTLRSAAQGAVTLTDADLGALALDVSLDKR
jgi:type II secretion system protein N